MKRNSTDAIVYEMKKYAKKMTSPLPVAGPRTKLYTYIFINKMQKNEAMKKIMEEFPAYDQETLKTWLKDEQSIKTFLASNPENEGTKDVNEER